MYTMKPRERELFPVRRAFGQWVIGRACRFPYTLTWGLGPGCKCSLAESAHSWGNSGLPTASASSLGIILLWELTWQTVLHLVLSAFPTATTSLRPRVHCLRFLQVWSEIFTVLLGAHLVKQEVPNLKLSSLMMAFVRATLLSAPRPHVYYSVPVNKSQPCLTLRSLASPKFKRKMLFWIQSTN